MFGISWGVLLIENPIFIYYLPKMKYIITAGFLLVYLSIFSQTNTDLFLVDINDGKVAFTNPINISNNEEY